jgi:uncharacterized cofD-like protein
VTAAASDAGPSRAPVRIVALGGGHGLSAALRSCRQLTDDVTAVVSVADDGGSSGRLVRELGMPPPGDARRCLVALAERDDLSQLFGYRFGRGELAGHALGNLVLAALTERSGDFATALDMAGALLHTTGRVLPAAVQPVRLVGEVEGGRVEGQAVLNETTGIRSVVLDPPAPVVHPDAVDAIVSADVVVIGPGSLFTSILPVVVIPGIRDALVRTRARRVLVANLTEQRGETEGLGVLDHLSIVTAHIGDGIVDAMLVNDAQVPVGTPLAAPEITAFDGTDITVAHLAADRGAVHDPDRLASALRSVTG